MLVDRNTLPWKATDCGAVSNSISISYSLLCRYLLRQRLGRTQTGFLPPVEKEAQLISVVPAKVGHSKARQIAGLSPAIATPTARPQAWMRSHPRVGGCGTCRTSGCDGSTDPPALPRSRP